MSALDPEVPVVVVAGRPNVGKSSLVNRIVGHRSTVVDAMPGVTRDRKVLDAEWAGVPFRITDTGGWTTTGNELDAKVSDQARRALDGAATILFVVDVTVGVTEEDVAAARMVRRAGPPVILVANKVDDVGREARIWELVALGLGDPVPVSALHGRGAGDLLDRVIATFAPDAPGSAATVVGAPAVSAPTVASPGTVGLGADGQRVPAVAVVGRPNVGKSTLFNRLIGEERSVVHDLPGTTRDTVDTEVLTAHGVIRFVDTAGMRRPARTAEGTEHYAVIRALGALERADIALLVIDATAGATHQDQRLAERIGASGCPAVVILNKWDLVRTEDREEVLIGVGDRLAFLGQAPVLRISASTGRGVHRVLPALTAAVDAYRQRIPTGALNRAIRDIQAAHAAPRVRIRYAVQGAVEPPTFTLFASGRLAPGYLRYVEKSLRERFDLGPTPLKLRVRLPAGR